MPGTAFCTVRYPDVVVVVRSAVRLKSMQWIFLQFDEHGLSSKTVQLTRFDCFFAANPFLIKNI